jgi:hypothetical protein
MPSYSFQNIHGFDRFPPFVKLIDHVLKPLALPVRFPRSDNALVEWLMSACNVWRKVNNLRILERLVGLEVLSAGLMSGEVIKDKKHFPI